MSSITLRVIASDTAEALDERLQFNIDTVLRLVCITP